MTDDDHEVKEFEGHLIIDWREGRMRHRKTEPDSVAPHEVVIPVSVDVVVPDVEVPEIHASVEVPPAKVERTITGGDAGREDE